MLYRPGMAEPQPPRARRRSVARARQKSKCFGAGTAVRLSAALSLGGRRRHARPDDRGLDRAGARGRAALPDRPRLRRRQRGAARPGGADPARRGRADGGRQLRAVLSGVVDRRARDRRPAQGGLRPCDRPRRRLLRGDAHQRDHRPADHRHLGHPGGRRQLGVGRAAQPPDAGRRHRHAVLHQRQADLAGVPGGAAGAGADPDLRAPGPAPVARLPGPARRGRQPCRRVAGRVPHRAGVQSRAGRRRAVRQARRAGFRHGDRAHPGARPADRLRHAPGVRARSA